MTMRLIISLALLLVPVIAKAQVFPAYSPQGYYSAITNHLRNPMVVDGVIQGENFTWEDKSLFSDALYADLLLVGKGPDEYVSGGTLGLTWQFKYGYVYGLASGYSRWEKNGSHGYGLLGGGVRKRVWKFSDINVYGQVSYGAFGHDLPRELRWEAGGYPLNHKWLQSSLHALGLDSKVTWFESRNRIGPLGIHFWENRDLDVRRTAFTLSRRSFSILMDSHKSSTWEAEIQLALIDMPRATERIWETRVKLFISTVGNGPKGEARPGVHLNVSYVSNNSSDYDGWGVELGFGAKQLDSNMSQELYFLVFYNYSAWYYRAPSLKWGLGLGGRI